MQHFKLVRVYHYTIGGSLIALLTMLLTWILSGVYGTFQIPILLLFASAGAIGGITFWFFRRPDRDARGSPPCT
jgi:hypothetical protein